jgi:hypothetical protein
MPAAANRVAVTRRVLWVAPAVVVLVALPLIAGSSPGSYLPLLAGGGVAIGVLSLVARGRRWAIQFLPAVTALELVLVALASQGGPVPRPRVEATQGASNGLGRGFPKLHAPAIDPADYLNPGPIARALQQDPSGRYVTFDPAVTTDPSNPRGFLFHQQPEDWAAYENGRAILLGLEEVQGYSPIQLYPYWSLVRRLDRRVPIYYNAAHLQQVTPPVLRLFATQWLIQPTRGGSPVATEGRYALYRVDHSAPRASLVFTWHVVDPGEGLDEVVARPLSFQREAIVAPAHGATPPPSPGRPSGGGSAFGYRELSPNHIRVGVSAGGPGLLVVRNAYDRGWVATVDGREQPVLVADYLMQGVPVPAGTHVVDLRYRDEPVKAGLIVSGVAWGFLGGAIALARPRRRAETSQS